MTTRSITVVCCTEDSYNCPLLYTVDLPSDLFEGSLYGKDIFGNLKFDQIRHEVAVQRAIDLDEDHPNTDGLILHFAFDGDLMPIVDWRL